MRYIALLRGINVGGNTMIKMADLKSSFEKLGFKDVVSYINSGNLAFNAPKVAEEKICTKIEKAVEKDFGQSIPVMIREQPSIKNVLANNPFDGMYESHKQMHVLFMKEKMPHDKAALLKAAETENEKFQIVGREIYALLKGGVADSLLGKGFIDKKLKVATTGRNWRTVQKLSEL
ncbi:MAG TPA: DUF1697 domain-containing protein [Pyrinomonadaceae bacterium]|nr:DUF1697 domain-containing protein [Pyrinomonadaceae bacterium]